MSISKKDVLWNAVGSTFNAFISLFFTIATTRINGEEQAGIFSLAFATASIMYIIGSYIVRAYQVTDITGEYSDTDYIYNRIITCVAMMLVSVGFVIIRGYNIYKAAIIVTMCLVRCIDAFAEILYGVLQKNERLYNVGISLFVRGILSVCTFIIVDILTKNLLASCISLVFVYILTILIIDVKNLKTVNITNSKFSVKKTYNLLKCSFLTFLISIFGMYIVNAPRYAIDDFMNDKNQTVFGIIVMPATVMALLSQYVVHPLLTKIATSLKNNDFAVLKKLNLTLLLIMSAFGLAIIPIAYVLEEPILSLVYGINLKPYKTEMMIIILGAAFYGIQTVFSNVLIALRKNAFQVSVLGCASLFAAIFSYLLVHKLGLYGASLTYLFTMIIVSTVFVIYIFFIFNRNLKV